MKKKKITNEEIIDCIRRNDDTGFNYIYNNLFPVIVKIILNHDGSYQDAEDIFQDAILVITEKIRNSQKVDMKKVLVLPMIVGIVKNMWLRRWQRNETYTVNINNNVLQAAEDICIDYFDSQSDNEQVLLMKRAIANCKPQYRNIAEIYMKQKDSKDGAKRAKCTIGYYRKLVMIAKQMIRKEMEKDPLYEKYFKKSEERG